MVSVNRIFLEKILPFLIAPIYWLYTRTWHWRISGPSDVLQKYVRRFGDNAPCVYAHWHGDELVLIGHYSYRRLAALSSLSKDGSIMALTLSLLGYRVFRGSSSKGGARGLLSLIRAVRDGAQAALAVDGPKGPIYEVKPGVVELARKTGQLIVPVRTFASRAWFIPRAWNKSYVPMPFSRVTVKYGAPIPVDESKDMGALCAKIKLALDGIRAQD